MRTDYKKEINNLTEGLPAVKLREVIDFISFLRAKATESSYKAVQSSAEYVQQMRSDQAKQIKSGRDFIEELIRWQESNSL